MTAAQIERLALHARGLSTRSDENPRPNLRALADAGLEGEKATTQWFFRRCRRVCLRERVPFFGDLGEPLGKALQGLINSGAFAWPLPARECIRATVMGAQHTIQVSGNTIYRSNDELLPRKNLQALRPRRFER